MRSTKTALKLIPCLHGIGAVQTRALRMAVALALTAFAMLTTPGFASLKAATMFWDTDYYSSGPSFDGWAELDHSALVRSLEKLANFEIGQSPAAR